MRSVTLEDGRVLRIGVFHTPIEDVRDGSVKRRSTLVRVSDGSNFEEVAEAACSQGDNFCKLEGRRRAATRLLRRLPTSFTKEDRRNIFFNVCPEFSQC